MLVQMISRIVYAIAFLGLVVSLFAIRSTSNSINHSSMLLPGDIPAIVYEPGPAFEFGVASFFDEKLPVVILCHGFTGNKTMMHLLATGLVRSGYAVVSIDFRGHGENEALFGYSLSGPDYGLLQDIERVITWVRARPQYDAERLALMGHSRGAGAVLQYAQYDPNISAVVPISGGWPGDGTQVPPNVFMIWAADDPASLRETARETAAGIAGLDAIALDTTVGDPRNGTGVRVSEVAGTDHITILYSTDALTRIVDWLGLTVGPGVGASVVAPAADPRMMWAGLALLMALVLLWGLAAGLAPLSPQLALPELERPFERLGIVFAGLVVAALVLGGVNARASGGALSWYPILGARDFYAYFALAGLISLILAARRGFISSHGFGNPRMWGVVFVAFGVAYLSWGITTMVFWDIFPASHRVFWCLVGGAAALPFFAASEWLLRGRGKRGVALPIIGKLLTLITIVIGAMVGVLPGVLLLGVGAIALYFVLFEIIACSMSRKMPNPWIPAIVQALFLGWGFAAVFPYTG
jgi:dienelactone hydrolase